MNFVSALGLAIVLGLFVRQLRRDPARTPPGKRYAFDALFVIYSLVLGYCSYSGYIESIDPIERAIYAVGIGSGAALLIALPLVRLTRLGAWVIKT